MASVDHDICAYPNCGFGPVSENVGKVEVRAFQLPPGSQHSLKLNWGIEGQAKFHCQCWAKVMDRLREGSEELSNLDRTLLTEAKKTAEFHDSDEQLQRSADHIALLLKKSIYAIAFTGAGVSTAAGIGDFRGKDGHWTNQSKAKVYGNQPTSRGHRVTDLRPTYTHEALLKLIELKLIKFVISQNTDGLHRLSGLAPDVISELHGNSFKEKCEDCDLVYERKGPVGSRSTAVPPKPCNYCHINHRTGRQCSNTNCNGYLMNTIINFGDSLMSQDVASAKYNARQSDLVLCLGSTLRVSPANTYVTMGKQPPQLIICNRQGTPYDDLCYMPSPEGSTLGSRVFGDCDRIMRLVMTRLMSEKDLKQWQDDKQDRMMKYNQLRD